MEKRLSSGNACGKEAARQDKAEHDRQPLSLPLWFLDDKIVGMPQVDA
jgi:hypothetical protein